MPVRRKSERSAIGLPVPKEHEDKSEGWKRAFIYALGRGNTEKGAALYATNHEDEFAELTNVP